MKWVLLTFSLFIIGCTSALCDPYEPNDLPENATEIDFGITYSSTLCTGDEDYFVFTTLNFVLLSTTVITDGPIDQQALFLTTGDDGIVLTYVVESGLPNKVQVLDMEKRYWVLVDVAGEQDFYYALINTGNDVNYTLKVDICSSLGTDGYEPNEFNGGFSNPSWIGDAGPFVQSGLHLFGFDTDTFTNWEPVLGFTNFLNKYVTGRLTLSVPMLNPLPQLAISSQSTYLNYSTNECQTDMLIPYTATYTNTSVELEFKISMSTIKTESYYILVYHGENPMCNLTIVPNCEAFYDLQLTVAEIPIVCNDFGDEENYNAPENPPFLAWGSHLLTFCGNPDEEYLDEDYFGIFPLPPNIRHFLQATVIMDDTMEDVKGEFLWYNGTHAITIKDNPFVFQPQYNITERRMDLFLYVNGMPVDTDLGKLPPIMDKMRLRLTHKDSRGLEMGTQKNYSLTVIPLSCGSGDSNEPNDVDINNPCSIKGLGLEPITFPYPNTGYYKEYELCGFDTDAFAFDFSSLSWIGTEVVVAITIRRTITTGPPPIAYVFADSELTCPGGCDNFQGQVTIPYEPPDFASHLEFILTPEKLDDIFYVVVGNMNSLDLPCNSTVKPEFSDVTYELGVSVAWNFPCEDDYEINNSPQLPATAKMDENIQASLCKFDKDFFKIPRDDNSWYVDAIVATLDYETANVSSKFFQNVDLSVPIVEKPFYYQVQHDPSKDTHYLHLHRPNLSISPINKLPLLFGVDYAGDEEENYTLTLNNFGCIDNIMDFDVPTKPSILANYPGGAMPYTTIFADSFCGYDTDVYAISIDGLEHPWSNTARMKVVLEMKDGAPSPNIWVTSKLRAAGLDNCLQYANRYLARQNQVASSSRSVPFDVDMQTLDDVYFVLLFYGSVQDVDCTIIPEFKTEIAKYNISFKYCGKDEPLNDGFENPPTLNYGTSLDATICAPDRDIVRLNPPLAGDSDDGIFIIVKLTAQYPAFIQQTFFTTVGATTYDFRFAGIQRNCGSDFCIHIRKSRQYTLHSTLDTNAFIQSIADIENLYHGVEGFQKDQPYAIEFRLIMCPDDGEEPNELPLKPFELQDQYVGEILSESKQIQASICGLDTDIYAFTVKNLFSFSVTLIPLVGGSEVLSLWITSANKLQMFGQNATFHEAFTHYLSGISVGDGFPEDTYYLLVAASKENQLSYTDLSIPYDLLIGSTSATFTLDPTQVTTGTTGDPTQLTTGTTTGAIQPTTGAATAELESTQSSPIVTSTTTTGSTTFTENTADTHSTSQELSSTTDVEPTEAAPEGNFACTSKITCSDGRCVNSPIDCVKPKCPLNKPILCRNQTCVDNFRHCLPAVVSCPGQITCWNGECKDHIQDCDPIPSCGFLKPYRCPDGTCELHAAQCATDNPCEDSPLSYRCVDGTCVGSPSDCPLFNGCPVIQCPNGKCAESLLACDRCNAQGEEGFVCIDSTCKVNPAECVRPPFLEKPEPIKYALNPQQEATLDIISDDNQILCTVTIPENTVGNSEVPIVISVAPIADSKLRDIKGLQEDEELEILSAPFDISVRYATNGSVVQSEFSQHVHITCRVLLRNNSLSDICLAFENEESWTCQDGELTLETHNSINLLTGITNHFTSFSMLVGNVPRESESECDDCSSSEGSSKTLFILTVVALCAAAVFIAVGIIAVVMYVRRENKVINEAFASKQDYELMSTTSYSSSFK